MKKIIGQNTEGVIYAVLAYISWGILPVFWKLLEAVPAVNILAHRVIWSSVFTMVFCLAVKRNYLRKYFTSLRSLAGLTVTGILVLTNWGVYIYAVNSGHMIEASLGYFINPLISIMLGMIFLGEKLNRTQISAFLLAMAGVIYLTVNYGHFPWIAIALALTFGIYGLLKKKMNYDAMSALAVETTLVAPIALCYLVFGVAGRGTFFAVQSISTSMLLVLTGIVTTLPLFWFGTAAVKIPLHSIGFIQYISPIINLFIGIFIFHETFSAIHAISFAFIWSGLTLYIGDMIAKMRRKTNSD